MLRAVSQSPVLDHGTEVFFLSCLKYMVDLPPAFYTMIQYPHKYSRAELHAINVKKDERKLTPNGLQIGR